MTLPFEKVHRKVLIRKNTEHGKFGEDPNSRTIKQLLDYGIINIDKPAGPTSHQVSAYVQKILGITKSGHSGTLDPKVTGVLPVAIGRATRIVQTLLVAGKEYICLMHLHKKVDEAKIRETLSKFVGKIKQLPPIKSSVKRQWRYRKVYYIEVLQILGQDVLYRIGCQAGTYIRKITHDIGQTLGCGAHMAELRRTKAGCFNEENLFTLQDLTDAIWYYRNGGNEKYIRKIIQPIENAVSHLPKVYVLDSAVDTICHGADVKIPGIAKLDSEIQAEESVGIMTLKDELVGYGKIKMISKEIIEKEKGVAVKVEKVFMLPGAYPKISQK